MRKFLVLAIPLAVIMLLAGCTVRYTPDVSQPEKVSEIEIIPTPKIAEAETPTPAPVTPAPTPTPTPVQPPPVIKQEKIVQTLTSIKIGRSSEWGQLGRYVWRILYLDQNGETYREGIKGSIEIWLSNNGEEVYHKILSSKYGVPTGNSGVQRSDIFPEYSGVEGKKLAPKTLDLRVVFHSADGKDYEATGTAELDQ